MKDGLPKTGTCYIRAELEDLVGCYDLMFLENYRPLPDETQSRVVARGFRAAMQRLRELKVIPTYSNQMTLMKRLMYHCPEMFSGLNIKKKVAATAATPQRKEMESDAAELERQAAAALWEDDLAPWEGLPQLEDAILITFLNDNPDADITALWNEQDDNTEMRRLAIRTVLASVGDEAWLGQPVCRSVILRTEEYRRWEEDHGRAERSATAPGDGAAGEDNRGAAEAQGVADRRADGRNDPAAPGEQRTDE